MSQILYEFYYQQTIVCPTFIRFIGKLSSAVALISVLLDFSFVSKFYKSFIISKLSSAVHSRSVLLDLSSGSNCVRYLLAAHYRLSNFIRFVGKLSSAVHLIILLLDFSPVSIFIRFLLSANYRLSQIV